MLDNTIECISQKIRLAKCKECHKIVFLIQLKYLLHIAINPDGKLHMETCTRVKELKHLFHISEK